MKLLSITLKLLIAVIPPLISAASAAEPETSNDYFILEEIAESNGWTLKGQEICNLKSECYPLYFQPSTEFQEVLPGQRIQKGLHVTIDYKTGVKMAKLLDPDEKDEYAMVQVEEKIPVIHKLEDLDFPSSSKNDLSMEEKLSLKNLFLNDINTTDPKKLGEALDLLADASHDLHVGIGIAYEKSYIDQLLSLLSLDHYDYQMKDTKDIIAAKSAQVLVSITSNNPEAIKSIQNHSPDFIAKLFQTFQTELDSQNPRKCKVCLKRIFQVIAMCARTDLDAFRYFMHQNPFPTLLEAIHKQTSLKDKIYPFFSVIVGRLSPSDSIPFQDWCLQMKKDNEKDLLERFSSLSPSCHFHINNDEL